MHIVRSLGCVSALVLGAGLLAPISAQADICSLPASSLTRAQLKTILESGCPIPAISEDATSQARPGPGISAASPDSSSTDESTTSSINVGVAGGGQSNLGGINAGVGAGAGSGNTGGTNVGVGERATSGNTGGVSVGLGSNAATGNTGGINADVGGGGTGAGSNNSDGIGAGIGGRNGVGVSAGSGGIGASVGGIGNR